MKRPKKRDEARRMFVEQDLAVDDIAELLKLDEDEVEHWRFEGGWTDARALFLVRDVAKAFADEDAADDQFKRLAQALGALAARSISKGSLSAREILALSQAVERAQRVRHASAKAKERRASELTEAKRRAAGGS